MVVDYVRYSYSTCFTFEKGFTMLPKFVLTFNCLCRLVTYVLHNM